MLGGAHDDPCCAHPPESFPPQLGHAEEQGPHVPVLEHVCGVEPAHCCEPGEHMPVHWPLTQACPVQATGDPHAPF
jgi:hypothetical protein